jgi:glycosyltransferase involved in cell wall biosynthesis
MRSNIIQCLFINELYVTDSTPFLSNKQVRFYQKNAAGFLSKAQVVFAGTSAQKDKLIEQFPVHESKIRIIQPGISSIYQPSGLMVRENIKELYAEGKEYFLFNGEVHLRSNLINLLKAFSFFKKRQKSNMLLLIVSRHGTATAQFKESLKTYKYRDEVKLYQDLPATEIAKVISAAYAFVYPATNECFPVPPTRAIECEVPLVMDTSLRGITGEAALYMDAEDSKDIADKMMLLFKDELLRSELIKTAGQMALQYRSAGAEKNLWNYITA